MSDAADDIDEDEWDEWISLPDAQQDAMLAREMDAYNRWFDSLTPLQQYRHRRRHAVETCLGWRAHVRTLDLPVCREYLRKSQRTLLKIRMDFYHGVRGGEQ